MPSLPRGVCPVCGKSVALRNPIAGERLRRFREHYVYRPQAEQDPTTTLGRVRPCEGSGRATDA